MRVRFPVELPAHVPAGFSLRRWAPPVASAAIVLAMAACGSSGTPSAQNAGHSPASTATRSHSSTTSTTQLPQESAFSPYTQQGTNVPGLVVTQKVSGHCTNPGVAGTRSYRCTAQPGSMTYDPCFAAPRTTTGPLLCVPYPTDTDVTQFDVGTLPATSPQNPPRQRWAIQLQNGQVCIFVRATWHGNGPFACPTPSATNSVADCRAPEYTASGWAASCQAMQDASSPYATTPVTTVWN